MLVISRRVGERFVIDGAVVVTVDEVSRDRVRLKIDAPTGVIVCREGVQQRLKEALERKRREEAEGRFLEGLEDSPREGL